MVSYTARARGSFCRHCNFGRRCYVFTGGTHQPVCTSTYAAQVVIEIDSTFLICRSPLGKLASGNAEIDKVFKDMWVEAEKNRTKWSCESQYRRRFLLSCIPCSILINLFSLLRSRKNRHLIRYFGR